jgi:hypothetical protein
MVGLLCVTIAYLITRKADGTGFAATLGGLMFLLSTMSDDIAIGVPVLSAFFASDERAVMFMQLHLILLSSLQALLINPQVFVLLGVGLTP